MICLAHIFFVQTHGGLRPQPRRGVPRLFVGASGQRCSRHQKTATAAALRRPRLAVGRNLAHSGTLGILGGHSPNTSWETPCGCGGVAQPGRVATTCGRRPPRLRGRRLELAILLQQAALKNRRCTTLATPYEDGSRPPRQAWMRQRARTSFLTLARLCVSSWPWRLTCPHRASHLAGAAYAFGVHARGVASAVEVALASRAKAMQMWGERRSIGRPPGRLPYGGRFGSTRCTSGTGRHPDLPGR